MEDLYYIMEPIGIHNDTQFEYMLESLIHKDGLYEKGKRGELRGRQEGSYSTFSPYESSDQLASEEDVAAIKQLIRSRRVFPFVTPVGTNESQDGNSVTVVYAVMVRGDGDWSVYYMKGEDMFDIFAILKGIYADSDGSESFFICNLYSLLVYHQLIEPFKDEYSDTGQVTVFVSLAYNKLDTDSIIFHQLARLDAQGHRCICIIYIHTVEKIINYFYVPYDFALTVHKALRGDSEARRIISELSVRESIEALEAVNSNENVYNDMSIEEEERFFGDRGPAESSDSNPVTEDTTPVSALPQAVLNSILRDNNITPYTTEPEEEIPSRNEENEENEENNEDVQTDSESIETAEASQVRRDNPLPENSNTFSIDETSLRFSSAMWYDEVKKAKVVMAGLGGIGSWVAFLLARMKCGWIKIVDPDKVEFVNMAGQLFGAGDIGLYKTDAIAGIMRNYSDYYSYQAYHDYYDENAVGANDIMICGFDNMQARKSYFLSWLRHVSSYKTAEYKKKCLFIDGRLAAEEFQILCIRGDHKAHIRRYHEHWLFMDESAEHEACSYKQTSYCANLIASMMVNLFVNHISNRCIEGWEKPVPFLTYYNASMMQLKMED